MQVNKQKLVKKCEEIEERERERETEKKRERERERERKRDGETKCCACERVGEEDPRENACAR